MFVLEKGMNRKRHLSQDEASLRQLLCILGFPMHQQYSKV